MNGKKHSSSWSELRSRQGLCGLSAQHVNVAKYNAIRVYSSHKVTTAQQQKIWQVAIEGAAKVAYHPTKGQMLDYINGNIADYFESINLSDDARLEIAEAICGIFTAALREISDHPDKYDLE